MLLAFTILFTAVSIGSFIFSLPYILLGSGSVIIANIVLFFITGLLVMLCEDCYTRGRS